MRPEIQRRSAARAEPSKGYRSLPTALGSFPLFTSAAALAVASAACGSSPSAESPSAPTEITCPPPIGTIQRESCADVAKDYDVLSVDGALKRAGTGPDAERRITAIKAAGSLASELKERRVALCEENNACKIPPKEHADRDKTIADAMSALVKLWDERKLTEPASVERFHEDVLALHRSIDPSVGAGGASASRGSKQPASAAQPAVRIEAGKLARIEGPAVTFKTESDAVTITVKDEASHDVLRAPSDLAQLARGKRYLLKLTGTYTPAAPPLLAPGDEVTVRLKFRASEASELYVALRSIEDPDSNETAAEWKIAAGDKGTREASLTAPAGSSGVYLGVGLRGAGGVELDDIELVRAGKVIASAQAESAAEPHVKTSCTPVTVRPVSGKRSLRCSAGSGDRLTIGLPSAHLFMAVRSASTGERAVLRTLSLEGGRSLDATLTEGAEVVLGLSGAGTATLRAIEISSLAR